MTRRRRLVVAGPATRHPGAASACTPATDGDLATDLIAARCLAAAAPRRGATR